MIRISAVSYLNTKPFILGLQRAAWWQEIELSLETPAQTALKLLSGEAQIGLVPVAVIPQLPNAQLISNYCIGTTGKVATVCLYSQVPLLQIEQIWLDYQSRTSVQLLQILCKHHWHIAPRFLPASEGFESQIEGSTAGLVIGDRAIALNTQFPYIYDLGEVWLQYAQLPFVFAAWVSTAPLSAHFEQQLNAAFADGLQHIDQVVQQYAAQYPKYFDIKNYLCQNICYTFDQAQKTGLQRFWDLLNPNTHTHAAL
jgi:chorismate dehydratase